MLKEQSSTVDSSMINKYVYNFATKTLKVEFKSGSLYEYNNVEPGLYDELCKFAILEIKYTHLEMVVLHPLHLILFLIY